MMNVNHIHHVAYRCRDAKETVDFYARVLNMEFILAFADDQVPSTTEPDPDMLEEWSRTKKAPRHAARLHELECRGTES